MNISLEYFLAVAEEESISRAAERVMVSQQDMSNHIPASGKAVRAPV